MEIIDKKSQIQIEFTSDEVNALKHILEKHDGNYTNFANELYELID